MDTEKIHEIFVSLHKILAENNLKLEGCGCCGSPYMDGKFEGKVESLRINSAGIYYIAEEDYDDETHSYGRVFHVYKTKTNCWTTSSDYPNLEDT